MHGLLSMVPSCWAWDIFWLFMMFDNLQQTKYSLC